MTALAERMTQALFAANYDDRAKAIERWGYEPEATKARYRTMGAAAARVALQEIERALAKP
jgi:hypothetical protein